MSYLSRTIFICHSSKRSVSRFRKSDDVLRDAAFGRAGDLELRLDRAQDFTSLRGDGVAAVGLHLVRADVVQRLPEDVAQAASGERADYGNDFFLRRPRERALVFWPKC